MNELIQVCPTTRSLGRSVSALLPPAASTSPAMEDKFARLLEALRDLEHATSWACSDIAMAQIFVRYMLLCAGDALLEELRLSMRQAIRIVTITLDQVQDRMAVDRDTASDVPAGWLALVKGGLELSRRKVMQGFLCFTHSWLRKVSEVYPHLELLLQDGVQVEGGYDTARRDLDQLIRESQDLLRDLDE